MKRSKEAVPSLDELYAEAEGRIVEAVQKSQNAKPNRKDLHFRTRTAEPKYHPVFQKTPEVRTAAEDQIVNPITDPKPIPAGVQKRFLKIANPTWKVRSEIEAMDLRIKEMREKIKILETEEEAGKAKLAVLTAQYGVYPMKNSAGEAPPPQTRWAYVHPFRSDLIYEAHRTGGHEVDEAYLLAWAEANMPSLINRGVEMLNVTAFRQHIKQKLEKKDQAHRWTMFEEILTEILDVAKGANTETGEKDLMYRKTETSIDLELYAHEAGDKIPWDVVKKAEGEDAVEYSVKHRLHQVKATKKAKCPACAENLPVRSPSKTVKQCKRCGYVLGTNQGKASKKRTA